MEIEFDSPRNRNSRNSNNDYLITGSSCTFIWKISNFSYRCKTAGEYIESPVFTVGDLVSDKIQWKLRLYPFGNKDDHKNYLSLYLQCIFSDDVTECSASFTCDLWSKNEIEKHNEVTVKQFNKKEKSFWGYGQFIDRNSEKLKNHLAASKNNTLSIECLISNVTPDYTVGTIHYVDFIGGLDSIFLSENLSDVTIKVGNKTLKAHKIILSARSEVFAAMFRHDTVENNEGVIEITDISYDVMKEVLRFIYCGKVENLDLHKTDLLGAATKYNLVALKNCCEEALWKNFSVDNICEILRLADLYQCDQLKTGAIKFMIKNIGAAFKTLEFFEIIDSNPNLLIDFFRNTVLQKD